MIAIDCRSAPIQGAFPRIQSRFFFLSMQDVIDGKSKRKREESVCSAPMAKQFKSEVPVRKNPLYLFCDLRFRSCVYFDFLFPFFFFFSNRPASSKSEIVFLISDFLNLTPPCLNQNLVCECASSLPVIKLRIGRAVDRCYALLSAGQPLFCHLHDIRSCVCVHLFPIFLFSCNQFFAVFSQIAWLL